jgi:hypothetical protein
MPSQFQADSLPDFPWIPLDSLGFPWSQDLNIFFKRVSEGQICDTAAWILHCYGFGIVASPYCSSVTSVRLFRDRMVLAGSSFHPGGLDDWVRCQGAVPDFGAR